MSDVPGGRRPPADEPATPPTPPVQEAGPAPVPDLTGIEDSSPLTVTDEDRTRYGVLLDHAAERGLLAPYDYGTRLRDLASATTVDQMNSIVSELPVFTVATPPRRRSRRVIPAVEPDRPLRGPAGGRRGANQWLTMAILVIIVVVSLVLLAVYAKHMVRTHSSGLRTPPTAIRPLSGLRL